jgi:hypothetical protein
VPPPRPWRPPRVDATLPWMSDRNHRFKSAAAGHGAGRASEVERAYRSLLSGSRDDPEAYILWRLKGVGGRGPFRKTMKVIPLSVPQVWRGPVRGRPRRSGVGGQDATLAEDRALRHSANSTGKPPIAASKCRINLDRGTTAPLRRGLWWTRITGCEGGISSRVGSLDASPCHPNNRRSAVRSSGWSIHWLRLRK